VETHAEARVEAADVGRREANKRATRAAIRAAADRLIAAQGFEATTVRQIADAAEVTERTFYRYFDGKEGLVVDEAQAWLDRLHGAIVDRPATEPPLQAVKAAIIELARTGDEQSREQSRAQLSWLFAEGAGAVAMMRRAGLKPLIRVERSIEDAVTQRGLEDPLAAALSARVAIAVLRSVAAQRRSATEQGVAAQSLATEQSVAQQDPVELIERAFQTLAALSDDVR